MTENPNETEKHAVTPELLNLLFARTGNQLIAEAEARRQAVEWPGLIEKMLGWLWRRSTAHADTLAAIETRIAALEAAAGTGPA